MPGQYPDCIHSAGDVITDSQEKHDFHTRSAWKKDHIRFNAIYLLILP